MINFTFYHPINPNKLIYAFNMHNALSVSRISKMLYFMAKKFKKPLSDDKKSISQLFFLCEIVAVLKIISTFATEINESMTP